MLLTLKVDFLLHRGHVI